MENFVDTEDLVDDNQNELPPLPSSPPPIELIPPMPSQMSNLNEIESTHLDFDPGLGEQLSNGVNSDEDEVSDEMLQSDDDEEEPPTKVQKLNMSNMHRFNEKNNEDDNSSIKNMEFDVLDEVNDDALDDSKEYYSDSSNDYIDHDEIDAMLDESLKKNLGKPGSLRESDTLEAGDIKHEVMQKIVLKAINRDHFEFLPEGWIEVTHNSGMPVYLHKESRVCSFSPPYFLGRGSARKHEIPMSAIPCLHYVTMLKKQKADLLCKAETNGRLSFKDWLHFANHLFNIVISKSVKGIQKLMKSVGYQSRNGDIELYFQVKMRLLCQMLKLKPAETKLITCQVQPSNLADKGNNKNLISPKGIITPGLNSYISSSVIFQSNLYFFFFTEFIMNPTGKSFICILHEYVQHSMRVQPKYKFKELENASFPYSAVVSIKDMEYGIGYGSSKKQAKSEAAKNTLEILIPQMKNFNADSNSKSSCHMSSVQEQDLSFFDEIRVEDPRVHELCSKAGLSSPYQLLLECLKRNYGMGDTEVTFETKMLKHQKNDFTMTVGKHKASVICKNKRDGKQRASQAILQALHPHITCWGSLLRLYGKGSCKTIKEKKQEEQEITELQNKACAHKPNFSILAKLKEEMMKLKDQRVRLKYFYLIQLQNAYAERQKIEEEEDNYKKCLICFQSYVREY
ncbi:Microprocessor complex subunit DGCR8 [Nymphon striatum]|nr:Microprocessor complex subunit DGCR8 [Nymphon striatum]